MAGLDRTLDALADPTRRGVVDLLRERPRRAGELAGALHMSAPAMSRHLRILRGAGLIGEESEAGDARVHLYRLRPEPFEELHRWVDEVEAFWFGELQAFKAYAEKTRPRKRAPR